ncbi:MAG: glycosyltransferase family 39 protein [Anaerolineae bacterium]|nr:glycosyltransferase family 39 protein [Anaerolineae bacterium]
MSERMAHWVLAVILILFVCLGLAYAFTTPTLEAPDEIHHYDYIRSLANTGGPPGIKEGEKSFSNHAPLYYAIGALGSFWVGENDLDAWRARYNPFFGYRFGDVGRDNKNIYLHPDDDRFGASDTWLGVRVVRALSVLMGAVTVWATFRVGREVFPEQPEMAVGAAGLAAFIPEFLFISGAVNDDNGAALFGALALWAMVRILRQGFNARRCLGLGLALGLGLLSKLTVIALLPTAGLVVILAAWRNRSWREMVLWGLVIFGVAALIGMPWFVRQVLLHGDPIGLSQEQEGFGEPERAPSLADLWPDLYWLRTSFWGRLGANQIPLSRWIYVALDIVTLVALGGLVRWIVLRRGSIRSPIVRPGAHAEVSNLRSPSAVRTLQLTVLAVAFLFTFGPMVVRRFLRPMPNFGRYLFPVLPAIVLLLFTGLRAWLTRRCPPRLALSVTAAMLMLGVAALVFFLAPAYSRPPIYDIASAPQPEHRLNWVYLEGEHPLARLLGYDLAQDEVEPGETLRVVLYWEALADTDVNYVLFAQLFGRQAATVGQRDTYTGLGHYPPSFWKPGQVIVDEVFIPVAPDAFGPSKLRLDVGLYRRESGERLDVADAAGNPVGAATIGWLKLAAMKELPAPEAATDYRFGDGIALVGYDLEEDGQELRLILHWASLAPVDRDYTVFVHLVGPDGALAQADGPPAGGDYPTSLWEYGEIVFDERSIPTQDLPAGTYHLRLGMYLLETGVRLPALDTSGERLPDDVVELVEVERP